MRRLLALAVVSLIALAGGAFAQTADDVITLAKKGINDEVLAAFVQAAPDGFDLSADDIIKLRDAKVSDKVVVLMLQHKPAVVIAPRAVARDEAPAALPPVATRPQPNYNNGRTWSDIPAVAEARPAPAPVQERTIIRERVVEVPSTTVVYRDTPSVVYADYTYPSYVYPAYYPSAYYYSGYCYPSLYVGFGYRGGYGYHGGYYGHSSWGGSYHSGWSSHGSFGGGHRR